MLPKSVVSFVMGTSCGVDVWPNGFVCCLKLNAGAGALLVPLAPKTTGAASLLVAAPAEICTGAEPNAKGEGCCAMLSPPAAVGLGPNLGNSVAFGNSNGFAGSGVTGFFSAALGTAGCGANIGGALGFSSTLLTGADSGCVGIGGLAATFVFSFSFSSFNRRSSSRRSRTTSEFNPTRSGRRGLMVTTFLFFSMSRSELILASLNRRASSRT